MHGTQPPARIEIPRLDLSRLKPGTPESIPLPDGPFWVFAYGSLMWDPGFDFLQSLPGMVYGYHRRLCLWSARYRGSSECPGLVLGLDRGGSCRGYTYLVDDTHADSVVEYLCERELVTGAYKPKLVSVSLHDGRKISALTFIAKPHHPHFAPRMSLEQILHVVRQAKGTRGCNLSYIINTVRHMNRIGINHTELHHLVRHLETI